MRAAAATALASFHSIQDTRETLVDARDNDPSELVRTAAARALGGR